MFLYINKAMGRLEKVRKVSRKSVFYIWMYEKDNHTSIHQLRDAIGRDRN